MDLETLHHLLLLGHVPNAGGHILQAHGFCLGVALFTCGVYNLGDFFIHLLEYFYAVGVAETHPEIVLVIQMNRFLVEFESSVIARKSIFVLGHVSLVKVVMSDWPNQVETAI